VFTVFGGDDEVPAEKKQPALWIEVGAKPNAFFVSTAKTTSADG